MIKMEYKNLVNYELTRWGYKMKNNYEKDSGEYINKKNDWIEWEDKTDNFLFEMRLLAIGFGIGVFILFVLAIVGMSAGTKYEKDEINSTERFHKVDTEYIYTNELDKVCIAIFYDKETKVMYFIDDQNHITPMVDAEGKPLLYEEE